ncbi:MAG TPA: hypothetical protein VFH34_08270 [Anaerolineales bacterium]|nr:hypothetical protein [Anaerolineales bacterium]
MDDGPWTMVYRPKQKPSVHNGTEGNKLSAVPPKLVIYVTTLSVLTNISLPGNAEIAFRTTNVAPGT